MRKLPFNDNFLFFCVIDARFRRYCSFIDKQRNENKAKMRPLRYLAVAVLMACLCGCFSDDEDAYLMNGAIYGNASETVYDGAWSVDGESAGSASMSLDSAMFTITPLPCRAILARLLPDRSIENVVETGYSAAYDIAAYSEQAVYFNIMKPSLAITADIDGARRRVDVNVGTYAGFAIGATATYSKLSDVYKIVMPICGCDIYDAESEEVVETSGVSAELVFLTTNRER